MSFSKQIFFEISIAAPNWLWVPHYSFEVCIYKHYHLAPLDINSLTRSCNYLTTTEWDCLSSATWCKTLV